MAISNTACKAAVKASLQASGFNFDNAPLSESYFNAIVDGILDHIKTNAIVSTNVAVASVSAVTPGVGVSGPGTGTGVGTIS